MPSPGTQSQEAHGAQRVASVIYPDCPQLVRQNDPREGAWVARSVKHPIFGFGSNLISGS